jgi:pimeloyl-ACP methyl ester carboxylesterase
MGTWSAAPRQLSKACTEYPRRLVDDLCILPGHLAVPANGERENCELMHAIDRFRRPRAESVLTTEQLAAISIPMMFIWGTQAPYLSANCARASIEQLPTATFHEVPGGHGPWLVHTELCAKLIQTHLASTSATSREINFPGQRHCP